MSDRQRNRELEDANRELRRSLRKFLLTEANPSTKRIWRKTLNMLRYCRRHGQEPRVWCIRRHRFLRRNQIQ
jgi:hypothetical protein